MNSNPGLKAWIGDELQKFDSKFVNKDPKNHGGANFKILNNSLMACIDNE